MTARLLYALARRWQSVRRALGHFATKHEQEKSTTVAGTRFWVALRQGQREAEAKASRLRH